MRASARPFRSSRGGLFSGGTLVWVAAATIVLLIVASQSVWALLVILLDGVPALAVLAAAALGGLWIVRAFGRESMPLRWHLMVSSALGIGVLSLVVLVLGLCGWLSAGLWYALLAVAGLAGLVRLSLLLRRVVPRDGDSAGRWRWLWLAACPMAALAILAASTPPGLLWAEEGNGYDVLEYHLQMPREYFEAGRITYAPHNVYANFPANAEMLYLLCMILKSDAVQAAAMAKMINLGLAALVAAAGWLIGREHSAIAGVVTGVVTATIGWLTYLSGLAYVENAMLFFGMMAMACLIRAAAADGTARPIRWLIVAGLLTGLALGCKYTAAALIAVPFGLIVVALPRLTWRRRTVGTIAYIVAAGLAFSPWLIKNVAMTGNPVFPLAGAVFTKYPEGWGPEQARHFAECHSPALDAKTPAERLDRVWARIPGDRSQRFGPAVFVLAGTGFVLASRRRMGVLVGLALGAQLLVWYLATYLYARFAVPLVIPLVALTAYAVTPGRAVVLRWLIASLVLAGATWNTVFAAGLYAQHLYSDGQKLRVEGLPELFTQGKVRGSELFGVVNTQLPDEAKVLLIGDARAFYIQRDVDYFVVFNRNPLADAVRAGASSADIVRWMRERGYTHVLVNWREIHRLQSSRYGFPPGITPPLFARLADAGLTHIQSIADSLTGLPYADLYHVPD